MCHNELKSLAPRRAAKIAAAAASVNFGWRGGAPNFFPAAAARQGAGWLRRRNSAAEGSTVLLRGTSLGNADMSPKHPPLYLQMLGVQANPPALKRFKYLATKLSAIAPDQESASGLGNSCTVLTLFRVS